MDEMLKLIHDEIKDMRKEFSEHNERLAAIETSLHVLVGNGQPGEIQKMKNEIAKNSSFRLKAFGALSVLATLNATVLFILHFIVSHLAIK